MKKIFNCFVFLFIFYIYSVNILPQTISTIAHRGNGVLELLKRYKLSTNMQNIEYFQKINAGNFDKNGGLLLDAKYILPIFVVKFDGNTIRSTLKISDFDLAKKIADYNVEMQNANIKKGTYQSTKEL
jgi:N-acetylmuramoyl-L-alanine amidase